MELSFIRFTSSKRHEILRFVHQQTHTHHHLNWRSLDDWLRDDDQLMVLAYREQQLVAVLACTPPRLGQTWLRLVSVKHLEQEDAFTPTLLYLFDEARQQGVQQIWALEMEPWLQSLLRLNGFRLVNNIVHLRREPRTIEEKPANGLKIQPVRRYDLSIIEQVDRAAFDPLWQMELADLRRAMNYANAFTMAIYDGRVVGYQLSTSYSDGIHLARLATWPSLQGRGVATTLVQHLIQRYAHSSITVNTQETNLNARRIYKRLGFEQQPMITPIWSRNLETDTP